MNEKVQAHNLKDVRTKDVLIDENVTFQSMLLSQRCLQGLNKYGYQKPSPIQLKSIPLGRCGFDLIVKSKSGTGKTLVFSVVALEMLDISSTNLQVLALAPTREIAVQISNTMRALGYFFDGLHVEYFIGGFPEEEDRVKAQKCQIAVGAPGRVKSLIEKNILDVSSVKLFVLDEADKLTEKSFLQDVDQIFQRLPQKKQIITASATYPNNLDDLLNKKYMQCATYVSGENDTQLLLGLKHFIREVKTVSNINQQMKLKNEELQKLLSNIPFTQCIIFSNYQTRAENISISLNKKGWNSMFISAAQSQHKRLEAMDKLKNFKCRILLSTDLTARGIDASNIDLVINYDIPIDVSTYLHRMGRAGRYGSKGVCISLVAGGQDLLQMRQFLGHIGGPNLTIAKLGEIENGMKDLWLKNESEFEKVSGILKGDKDAFLTIKNEVLSLKTHSFEPTKTKTDCNNKFEEIEKDASEEKPADSTSDTSLVLEKSEIGTINKSEKIEKDDAVLLKLSNEDEHSSKADSNVDEISCLQSLAKGHFSFDNTPVPPKINLETIPVLDVGQILGITNNKDKISDNKEKTTDQHKVSKNLANDSSPSLIIKNLSNIPVELIIDEKIEVNHVGSPEIPTTTMSFSKVYEKCEKVRKSSELETNNYNKISKNEIYMKNKGIYEVARILNSSIDLNEDVEENISNFLKTIDKNNTKTTNTSVSQPTTDVINENIFTAAYLYTIRKENHWKNVLGDNDSKENQHKSTYEDLDSMNTTEDHEEVENEEMDVEYSEDLRPEVQYDENGYEYIPNRMVWVPVEKGTLNQNRHSQINLLDESSDQNDTGSEEESEEQYDYTNDDSNKNIFQKYLHYSNTTEHTQSENEMIEKQKRHFEDCYQKCLDELKNKRQTFSSKEEFSKWYTEVWEVKMSNVGHYVRKCISTRELNRYQNFYAEEINSFME